MKIHWINKTKPEQINILRNHHDLNLILVCSGLLLSRTSNEELTIPERSIILIPPGINLLFEPCTQYPSKIAWVSLKIIHWHHPIFRQDSETSIYWNYRLLIHKLNRPEYTLLSHMLRLMDFKNNYGSQNLKSPAELLEFIFIKEVQFILQANCSTNSRSEPLANRFLKQLIHSFMNHHSVSYYADLLCITPDTLNKSVKNLFGKSAKQFINDFLIQEAEWLLTKDRQT